MKSGLRDHDRRRGPTLLPGTSIEGGEVPLAYIYRPSPSPTQSAPARRQDWVLEFEPATAPGIDPLMGWTSSRDPFATIPRLHFPDRESAIAYAERHGWAYVVQDAPARRFRAKSYADHLRYDLADAVSRTQWQWHDSAPLGGSTLAKAESQGLGPTRPEANADFGLHLPDHNTRSTLSFGARSS